MLEVRNYTITAECKKDSTTIAQFYAAIASPGKGGQVDITSSVYDSNAAYVTDKAEFEADYKEFETAVRELIAQE